MTWTCLGCAPKKSAGLPEPCPRCTGFTTISTATRVRPAIALERKRANARRALPLHTRRNA